MKKATILLAAVVAAGAVLQAQSVFFSNEAARIGTPAPVYDADVFTKLSGTAFWVELYLIQTGGTLSPVGEPIHFETGPSAGFFNDPTPRLVPAAANSSVALQVGAWTAPYATLNDAQQHPDARWGLSLIVPVQLGNDSAVPPNPPATLTGLQSFSFFVDSPEPPTLALAAIGVGMLLVFRRR